MGKECEIVSAPSSFYLAHKQELSENFHGFVKGVAQFWEPEFGLDRAQAMAEQAVALFDRLLPGFPDVGGERNWCSQFIPLAAWYVAIYAPMRANGKTAEDVGKLVYELNGIRLKDTPKEKAIEEGEKMFTQEALEKMRDWVAWTQKREFPANWVAEFMQGDGNEFDWGYDYTECGVVNYFRAQGAPELAPYFCLIDFQRSAALGSGLHRSKTIAQGDDICDFRYKKGRPILQDWSTEMALIRSRMSR